MNDTEIALHIAELVKNNGGTAYYVGGYVRDRLMGLENKDIDIEVHGIQPEKLEEILDCAGERICIGESFGVYSLKGHSIDIAMPRKEYATGTGHRDFKISVDPFIGTEKAAQRRDFTVNALMENVLTGEITDHFGGLNDLEKGILRHVSDKTFPEDPLRVLRAAQFAARFEFAVSSETLSLCRDIDLGSLSRERVEEELKKALLKAGKPSVFFETLREMNQLGIWFPEIERLIGIPQHKLYHKEGDVWNHTMMVLDAAAGYRDKTEQPYCFMMTALVHDLGKIVSTAEKNGIHHAYGHETAGLPITEAFLRRISNEKKLIRYVLNMTELHMKPNTLACADSSVKSTNKMFDKAASPLDLIYIALADDKGRITEKPAPSSEDFLFERLRIFNDIMKKPHVTGKDLIDAGFLPDKHFSEILAYAHKLRLAGVDRDSALKQTVSFGIKLKKD